MNLLGPVSCPGHGQRGGIYIYIYIYMIMFAVRPVWQHGFYVCRFANGFAMFFLHISI
jgi:hypothetical protein